MRDYSNWLKKEITWKSNEEIKEFERNYKSYIINNLKKNGIDEFFQKALYDDILIKFSSGRLEYDSRIGKFETFLFRIVTNAARDFYRENKHIIDEANEDKESAMTENTKARVTLFSITDDNMKDFHISPLENCIEFEHYRVIAIEALKRLWRITKFKKEKMEIFARRCFAGESVPMLADEYEKSPNEISLIVSRYHKKYKELLEDVQYELEDNQMSESRNISIDFLEPIIDFPLSVA